MEIKEYKKEVLILGFKDVKIDDATDFLNRIRKSLPNAKIQLFDADYIAGAKHLLFATLNALKAFKQGRNISENLMVECLLYASGQRQISRAIEMLGIRSSTSRIAVLMLLSKREDVKKYEKEASKLINGIRDERVLDIKEEDKIERLMEVFGITTLELDTIRNSDEEIADAIVKAIIERSAILAVMS